MLEYFYNEMNGKLTKLQISKVIEMFTSVSTIVRYDDMESNIREFLKSEVLVNFSKDSFESENLTVNSPVFLKDEPKKTPSRGPDLGEHSKEILAELGMSDAAIDQLPLHPQMTLLNFQLKSLEKKGR